MKRYIVLNQNDSDCYDLIAEHNNGVKQVYATIHCDFFTPLEQKEMKAASIILGFIIWLSITLLDNLIPINISNIFLAMIIGYLIEKENIEQ